VVGAGIAGLIVANALTLGRIGCVVVEARKRTDGAMTSGIRAAKRLLGQSAVGLGRLAH
jgi:2-polyprenyl-6-methoxyphenol hydroxylase-like FAD-dependent oxidoreductase